MKYEIVKIDRKEKKYEVIRRADSKLEAQEWIINNEHKYPGWEINFVRRGFTPVMQLSEIKKRR